MMKSIFELIEEDSSKEFVSAVFMTYGFDAELFEQHVLPAVLRLDVDFTENEKRFRAQVADCLLKTPVTVLVDASGYKGGKTFLYDLFNVKGCTFHPKCFMLLYEDYLRIIIGSCNMTKPGLCYNAEVFWHYDIKKDDESGISVDISTIIKNIMEFTDARDNPAMKQMTRFLDGIEINAVSKTCEIHSSLYVDSFAEKLVGLVNKSGNKLKAIRIVSPFFESEEGKKLEGSMMGQIFNRLEPYFNKNYKVEFCFTGTKTGDKRFWSVDAPVEMFKELSENIKGLEFYIIPGIWEDEGGEEHLRSLHAKIVELSFDGGGFMYLVGSPNFTRAAMNSKAGNMKNLEIGVFETSPKRLWFPKMENVKLGELIHSDIKHKDSISQTIFINEAKLDFSEKSSVLSITIDVKTAKYPFKVLYQNKVIYNAVSPEETIKVYDFHLGKEKDLLIVYDDASFAVPIDVIQKHEASWQDIVGFELDHKIGINDVISYLAGKYRSIEELVDTKSKSNENGPGDRGIIAVGFQGNLNLFFKAMDSIKQSLEKPAWSEAGFRYELYSPLGLIKLVELFEEEYNTPTVDGLDSSTNHFSEQELFFYLAEMVAKIKGLSFQPDILEGEFKRNMLREVEGRSLKILKAIASKAKGNVKRQYDLIAKEYGLGRLDG